MLPGRIKFLDLSKGGEVVVRIIMGQEGQGEYYITKFLTPRRLGNGPHWLDDYITGCY